MENKTSVWSLYEGEKSLPPLVFSNGKSQADIVQEVLDAIKEGNKVIFIKGVCGTGKSAIALNLARILGKTSIVVPIKSLQEQYIKDYSGKKYLLKPNLQFKIPDFPELKNFKQSMQENERLKISSLIGRSNFKCKFLEDGFKVNNIKRYYTEKNTKLSDIFSDRKSTRLNSSHTDISRMPSSA